MSSLINAFRRWRVADSTRKELRSMTRRDLDDLGIAPGNIDQIAKEEAALRFP